MASPSADPLSQKLERLREYLRGLHSALICYSGGIDSALVLAVASQELGERAIGMTAISPSLSASERDGASHTAALLGAQHRLVDSNELARPGYVHNGPDRCFHCKSELYDIAQLKCAEWDLKHILNGTNTDDLGDYRPGLVAAKNAGVKSPLVDLGFNKADVREAAKRLQMPIWDKPAMACLSSRIPYGTEVTPERLAQIAGYEAQLRELGFRQLRVRYHGDLARLEFGSDELQDAQKSPLKEQILQAGVQHGFSRVEIDPKGYRQGSHNEALGKRALPLV